jgi:putative hydrolase
MNISIDTHTHSIASGHAYSTIDDLARAAREHGLAGFVLSDHGPSMGGAPHRYFFGNLKVIPKIIFDVKFYSGIESNILNEKGETDLPLQYAGTLDFILAGFHEICFEPRSEKENTKTLIAAIANPLVDAISHPGNGAFPINIDAVVDAAKAYDKVLEINNSSFKVRHGSKENCRMFAQKCVEKGVLMCCSSDTHYRTDIGVFTEALKIFDEVHAKPENIINSSVEKFEAFIKMRKKLRNEALQSQKSF